MIIAAVIFICVVATFAFLGAFVLCIWDIFEDYSVSTRLLIMLFAFIVLLSMFSNSGVKYRQQDFVFPCRGILCYRLSKSALSR